MLELRLLNVQRWRLNKLENNQRDKVVFRNYILQPHIERASYTLLLQLCLPRILRGSPAFWYTACGSLVAFCTLLRSACQEAVRKTIYVDTWAQISDFWWDWLNFVLLKIHPLFSAKWWLPIWSIIFTTMSVQCFVTSSHSLSLH